MKASFRILSVILLSSILPVNAQVMHVVTPQGETAYDTQQIDSIYFDDDISAVGQKAKTELDVVNEQRNHYPSDLFTQSLIMCHCGLAGFPENTKEALEAAIKVGYKMVECDIARTSDGVFVLQHDATIDRCSNGTGRVDSHTFAELQKLDFGSWYNSDFSYIRIASLEEVIKLCKRKNVILELDIADDDRFSDAYIPDLFKLVQKHGMLSRTVFCAKKSRLEVLQEVSSCVCVSVSGVNKKSEVEKAVELKSKSLSINVSIPFAAITPELCEYAHSLGMYVKTWTYNRDADMDDAFEKGADYVIVKNVIPTRDVKKDKSQNDE
jgi:glycerophosphoryl diester phosphodiesterase